MMPYHAAYLYALSVCMYLTIVILFHMNFVYNQDSKYVLKNLTKLLTQPVKKMKREINLPQWLLLIVLITLRQCKPVTVNIAYVTAASTLSLLQGQRASFFKGDLNRSSASLLMKMGVRGS